jgi:phosphatidylserine synthase
MARLDIQPRIVIPKNPVIRYARFDLLETANNARYGFEIALAAFMMLVGVHLSSKDPVPPVHWFSEVASAAAAIALFLWSKNSTQRAIEGVDEIATEEQVTPQPQDPEAPPTPPAE